MKNYQQKQYENYKKPSWAPPSWLFGPVWIFLYTLIVVSFGYVAYLSFENKISFLVFLPFLVNIILNASYTFIQFRLKNYLLAAIDTLLIWATIIWFMIVIFPIASWVAYINIPYLLWVSFATVLQINVAYLNRKHE